MKLINYRTRARSNDFSRSVYRATDSYRTLRGVATTIYLAIALALILSACAPATAASTPTPIPTLPATATQTADPASFITPLTTVTLTPPVSVETSNLFAVNNIQLGTPACDGTPAPAQTEGPYYTPDTPERNSLIEPGITGQRLFIVGYVLDTNCQPIPGAWLDFWQADTTGVYDNAGYKLRGHQFTDQDGRYFLDTILPGEYTGRTVHIHVKLQAPGGGILTTQLYFPGTSANAQDPNFDPALLVRLENNGDTLIAYFNFVLAK